MKQLSGNKWDLGAFYSQVNEFVQEKLSSRVNDWFNTEFAGHTIVAGKHGEKTFYGKIQGLQDSFVVLPWPRLFDVKIEPHVQVKVN